MKGYQITARSIAQSGIDTVFGLAGDANLYMIDELIRVAWRQVRAGRPRGGSDDDGDRLRA